jgi:hypothetical protein
MSERIDTLQLANRLLDEPFCDPDDDLRTLCRQLLRTAERQDKLMAAVRAALTSLSQSATYEVPPIVVRDVADRLQQVNQELNLP